MNGLPPFPLFYWATRSPVFVINQHVYLPNRRTKDVTAFLDWEGQRSGLSSTQTLEAMGCDYLSQNVHTLESWQMRRLQEQGEAAVSLSGLRAKIQELETVVFLCHRLIPRLQQMRGEPRLSFSIPPDAAAPLKERWEQHFARMSRSLPSLTPLWSSLPSVGAWGFVDGQLYHLLLERPSRRPKGNRVTLPDASYALEGQSAALKDVAAKFYHQLEDLLTEHARGLLPHGAVLMQEAQRALEPYESLLATLPTRNSQRILYDNPPWRVFQWQGHWLIGLGVEKYVLEDKDGSLYAFDSTTIYVGVDAEGSVLRAPEVGATRYEHPFVPSDGRSICMGNYGETGWRTLRQLPPEDRLLQYLMDARQTLLAGYHQHNPLTPYHALSAFPHRRISREQARAQNLPVYPYHRRS